MIYAKLKTIYAKQTANTISFAAPKNGITAPMTIAAASSGFLSVILTAEKISHAAIQFKTATNMEKVYLK